MHTHHAIDYIGLTVKDMAAAKRFYSRAFGWVFTDYGPDYAGTRVVEPVASSVIFEAANCVTFSAAEVAETAGFEEAEVP